MMENMSDHEIESGYADPVRRLLAIGSPSNPVRREWPDYAVEYGLGREHIDDLIRMSCDMALHESEQDDGLLWAPVHAWRTLGQLRAEAAVAPLLALVNALKDDDAAGEELPVVFGMIGPIAVQPLAELLADHSTPSSTALAAIDGVKEIGKRHPACRGECIDVLVRVLEPHEAESPWVNGFAVWALTHLAAVEAIEAIRAAYRRGAVDLSVNGDEEDTEIALGLRETRATPKPSYSILPEGWKRPEAPPTRHVPTTAPKSAKIGRNDPCPCGSGKKYKKCCLP
jgi:hypothetical protein